MKHRWFQCRTTRLRLVGPQPLWQCYDVIYHQQEDRRIKNWRQLVRDTYVIRTSITRASMAFHAMFSAVSKTYLKRKKYPGPRGFLSFFLGKFCDANRGEPRKPFFSLGSALWWALRVANFQIKKDNIKRSLWDQRTDVLAFFNSDICYRYS